MSLVLSSPAFRPLGEIPARYTCEGEDVSPPLEWSGIPVAAESLLLIVDDPDAPDPAAPKRCYVHWLLYNLPPTSIGLPEDVSEIGLPAGTLGGISDYRRTRYGGPCPPIGRHRYFFKLYALDLMLPDLREPTKPQLEAAMAGHVVEQTELVGTYQRQKPRGR